MKRRGVYTLLFIFILFFSLVLAEDATTNVSVNSAFEIYIESPASGVHFFEKGEDFIIELNVSSNLPSNSWTYTLENLRDDIILYENESFSPNTTFEASRWEHKLTVRAMDTGGNQFEEIVFFDVTTNNSAPLLGEIDDQIYFCESTFAEYIFNATDLDRDILSFSLTPTVPFHLRFDGYNNETNFRYKLFSTELGKSDVGNHTEIIEVSDGEFADSTQTNITVIEINNLPEFLPIGVQTVWTSGEDSSLYIDVEVIDIEEINKSVGDLNFSVSFSDKELFEINNSGIIEYVANSSDLGLHEVSICVEDTGISNIHENISICGQDGGSNRVCENFSLSVVETNRPPEITSYSPAIENLEVNGLEEIVLSVVYEDPDETIPDLYWLVNGVEKKYVSGENSDEFSFMFDCGVSGTQEVTALVTDGLLNDTQSWPINVQGVSCPVKFSSPSGGGGGGGDGFIQLVSGCNENWGCTNWRNCNLFEGAVENGNLTADLAESIEEKCRIAGYTSEFCGYQTRSCEDFNSCSSQQNSPENLRVCYYTEDPSCSDGIINCHNGACEVLVDCGGPCDACPSCSDGIKNQGEFAKDCGGPCQACIDVPKTLSFTYIAIFSGFSLVGFSVLFLLFRRIRSEKRRLREIKSQGRSKSKESYFGKI